MILGQVKELKEISPLTDEQFQMLMKVVQNSLSQGIPPEIPAAVPHADLYLIASTLQKYRDQLVSVMEAEPEGSDRKKAIWDLINPASAPKVSKLVLPGTNMPPLPAIR
jgi:hypothetical protein